MLYRLERYVVRGCFNIYRKNTDTAHVVQTRNVRSEGLFLTDTPHVLQTRKVRSDGLFLHLL